MARSTSHSITPGSRRCCASAYCLANTEITLATALTSSRAGGRARFLAGDKVAFRVIRAYKTTGRDAHDAFVCAIELRLLDASKPPHGGSA